MPNEEKGDFNINAHGSSALVERAIQDQVIQQLVEPSLNPAFELSPARVMEEYLKSKRIDAGHQAHLVLGFPLPALAADDPVGELMALAFGEGAIDRFVAHGREVYWLRRDRDKSPFSNNMIEKALGTSATARNLNTMTKIVEKYG